jgi:hypothetical protein
VTDTHEAEGRTVTMPQLLILQVILSHAS